MCISAGLSLAQLKVITHLLLLIYIFQIQSIIISCSAAFHHTDNFIVILWWSNAFTYQLLLSLFLSLAMWPYSFWTFKLYLVVSGLWISVKFFYLFLITVFLWCLPQQYSYTEVRKYSCTLNVLKVTFYMASTMVSNVSLTNKLLPLSSRQAWSACICCALSIHCNIYFQTVMPKINLKSKIRAILFSFEQFLKCNLIL